MNKHGYSCSARTLTDYLKVMMKELNPEDVDGYVDDLVTIDDYRIIPKGLDKKLHDRDIGIAALRLQVHIGEGILAYLILLPQLIRVVGF